MRSYHYGITVKKLVFLFLSEKGKMNGIEWLLDINCTFIKDTLYQRKNLFGMSLQEIEPTYTIPNLII